MMALFGILGFFMRRYDLPIPPMILGIILGPLAEDYFITSLVSHGGDLTAFLRRPVSAALLLVTAALLVWPAVAQWRRRREALST